MGKAKPMKLCTYSFMIYRDGEYVPFESIPKEEQEAFKDKFTEDFTDSMMRSQGYRRVGQADGRTA